MKAFPILMTLLAACDGSEMLAEQADGTVTLRDGVVISGDGDGSVRHADTGAPASLFDAFAAATYHHTITLDPEAVTATLAEAGVTVDARITVAPSIELAFEIDDAGLARFDTVARGSFDAVITSTARMTGGGWDDVQTIASDPQRILTIVDGVPVVLGVRVVTDLAVYAGGTAELGTALATHVTFDTGVHFTRGAGWMASDASRPAVGAHQLTATGKGHTNAVATVRLELSLYGEVVPYVQLRAVQSVEAGTCASGSYEALEVGLGGGVGVAPSTLLPGAALRYTPAFASQFPLVSAAACP
jgi:hypothetical protein